MSSSSLDSRRLRSGLEVDSGGRTGCSAAERAVTGSGSQCCCCCFERGAAWRPLLVVVHCFIERESR